MSKEEKYGEIQKFFYNDYFNSFDIGYYLDMMNERKKIKEIFDDFEDWQKDMFLAMIQNIDFVNDPINYGAQFYQDYEKKYGDFNREKEVKIHIRKMIEHGACINKFFLNFKKRYKEKIRIIDRLEYLYNKCLKPLMVFIDNREEDNDKYKIENNLKNRFLNKYYFNLKETLKEYDPLEETYADIDELFDLFKNNETIPDDVYLQLANRYKIDTKTEKKYWMAEVDRRTPFVEYFNKYKEQEKEIEYGIKEIEAIKSLLTDGDIFYYEEIEELFGGTDKKSIIIFIDHCRRGIDYNQYLGYRDKELTQKLLNDLDKLSLTEIRNKYFECEVIIDE